jgi:hypothetical protein
VGFELCGGWEGRVRAAGGGEGGFWASPLAGGLHNKVSAPQASARAARADHGGAYPPRQHTWPSAPRSERPAKARFLEHSPSHLPAARGPIRQNPPNDYRIGPTSRSTIAGVRAHPAGVLGRYPLHPPLIQETTTSWRLGSLFRTKICPETPKSADFGRSRSSAPPRIPHDPALATTAPPPPQAQSCLTAALRLGPPFAYIVHPTPRNTAKLPFLGVGSPTT